MKTPFTITVRPAHRLYPCALRREEESKGFYCHRPNCPDCRRELEGFELWGENGHLQGTFRQQVRPTAEELKTWAEGCRFSSATEFIQSESGFTYYA